MTTYARCQADVTVAPCNIRTLTGNKGRKAQRVSTDEELPVVRRYTCTSIPCHGDPVLVLARGGYHLHVRARDFQVFALNPLAPQDSGG